MLDGFTVLDLSGLFPGPYCTLVLADLGAEVIKVEDPGQGDSMRGYPPFLAEEGALYTLINRNKKSVALDLRQTSGREAFYRLVERADVVVEGFRPQVKYRLGISYEDLSAVNPRLVYCSITGFGQDGPYRDLPSHDLTLISLLGLAGLYRREGEKPAVLPVPIADMGAAQAAVSGILAALLSREKTGRGNFIDISMFDTLFQWLTEPLASLFAEEKNLGARSIFSGKLACYNLYSTADGRFLALAAIEEKFWSNLCRLAGREDFVPFQFEPEKQPQMYEFFVEFFSCRTLEEWLQELALHRICCGPVKTLTEVLDDPQVTHRELVMPVSHPRLGTSQQLRPPTRFGGLTFSQRLPAPGLGEHTREILSSLGYSDRELEALTAEGAAKSC